MQATTTIFGVQEATLKGVDPYARYACGSVTLFRDYSTCCPLARYVLAEIGFAGVTIFSALETIASAIALLFLKCVSFFVSDSAHFETNYLNRARNYAITSFLITNTAALSLIENVRNDRMNAIAFVKVLNFYRDGSPIEEPPSHIPELDDDLAEIDPQQLSNPLIEIGNEDELP